MIFIHPADDTSSVVGKVKFALEQAIKAQKGGQGITLHFL
jgi:hypothetical protein